MQSQFGRDVLGTVRLDEARRHKAKEKEILADISDDTDKETMKSLKQEAKAEKQEYSQLKKLRWSLLTNSDKLSDSKTEQLQSILQDHHDRACKIKCVSQKNNLHTFCILEKVCYNERKEKGMDKMVSGGERK